jgi:hypothetical protein
MQRRRTTALVAILGLALTVLALRPVIAATSAPRSDEQVVACPGATAAQQTGADLVVSGNADDEINQALTNAGGNGSVLVVGGTCNLGASVRLREGVRLHCDSWGTELKAAVAGVDVVTLDSVNVERAHFDHCTVNGNKGGIAGAGRGVVIDNTGGTFEYNDPSIVVTDTIVKNTGGDGVWVSGRSRATRMDRVRVEKAGGDGFVINAVDSFFNSIESGGAAGYGLDLEGANTRIVDSKFWFSDLSGVLVHGVRNTLVGVESQDNLQHGFEITLGKNVLQGTQADSNGWTGSACTAGTQAGYLVSGADLLVDGIGFDKHESNRNGGLGCQEFGVQFTSAANSPSVITHIVTYGNLTGPFTGTKPANALVVS